MIVLTAQTCVDFDRLEHIDGPYPERAPYEVLVGGTDVRGYMQCFHVKTDEIAPLLFADWRQ